MVAVSGDVCAQKLCQLLEDVCVEGECVVRVTLIPLPQLLVPAREYYQLADYSIAFNRERIMKTS
jgi:hypothetical protein